VRELESVFNAQRLRGQQTAAKSSSPTLQKWRQLKTGMNTDAVRALLGEPERVNGGTVASWSYPNGSRVGFISDALSQWSEPNSFPSDQ
jgi:outer membrane protein assembly factor BamE (lipoprotein component of BamABCDE complex)